MVAIPTFGCKTKLVNGLLIRRNAHNRLAQVRSVVLIGHLFTSVPLHFDTGTKAITLSGALYFILHVSPLPVSLNTSVRTVL